MRDDDYTAEERRLFEALPRESAPDGREEERIAARLRVEGFFRRPLRHSALLAVAATALLAIGFLIGSTVARPDVVGSACAELPGTVPSSAEPARQEPVRTAGVLWF